MKGTILIAITTKASRSISGVVAWLFYVGILLWSACDVDPQPGHPAWEEAFDAQSAGWLMNVFGPGDGSLLAVGGTYSAGSVWSFGGSEWSEIQNLPQTPLLNWGISFSGVDTLIVGNGGTLLRHSPSGWSLEELPTEQDLWGVWGHSPEDVWVVGGGQGVSPGDPVILHWNGDVWEDVAFPELERPNVRAFYKVWGSGPDDVYVVGQKGAVLHWNGINWEERFVGADQDLVSLWGMGPDRIAMVGGRNNGIFVTWNGQAWTTYQLAPTPGLNGVWMRDADAVHVVGTYGTWATVDFETGELKEDLLAADPDLGDTHDLHAITGDGVGNMIAVGGTLRYFVSGPFEGIALSRVLSEGE